MADDYIVSDDEVQASRQHVDELREAIAAEKAQASALATSDVNAYRKTVLDHEAANLEAELAALREANNPEVLAKLREVGTGAVVPEPEVVVAEPGEKGVPTTPSGATGTLGGMTTSAPAQKKEN